MTDLVKNEDSLEMLDEIDDQSLDLIVTSPPYWAKREYRGSDPEGQIGLEATPESYVTGLVSFFHKYGKKLKESGNLYVNIGDTFFGSGAGAWKKYANGQQKGGDAPKETYIPEHPLQPKIKQNGKLYQNKQLLLIPARFAIAMQEDGWILRDDIIWRKPNRIPSSVKDRMNNTYEHVYHFVKQGKYFFNLDPIKVEGKNGKLKNPGDVWDINTQPVKDGHHTATFPEELVQRIVLSSSPEGGVVNDPFLGTGTTWIVSSKCNRSFIGSEISKEYYEIANKRFRGEIVNAEAGT